MDSEVDPIPEGWTLDPEELKSEIPDGWTLDPEEEVKPTTARDRDLEKFQKASGLFAVENKTREELKAMSYHEKMHYLKRLELAGTTVAFKDFSKGTLSGVTFGQSKKWSDSLKPTEFEENSNVAAGLGEITGSTLPLSGMIKVVGAPVAKLAAKSPILQKQVGSFLTMIGVGGLTKATEQLAQGETPSAAEVLEHGAYWGALDLALQTAGLVGKGLSVAGKFTKDLLFKSAESGQSPKYLINKVTDTVKPLIDGKASPEEISQAAFKVLEEVQPNPEMAAQRLQGYQKEISQAEQVAQQSLKESTVTPKDLAERKVANNSIQSLKEETTQLAETIQPGQKDFRKEIKALEELGISQKLEAVSERAGTKEELGTAIREDINAQRKAEKAAYKPLYEAAEEQAQYIPHHADETAQTAFKTLIDLSTHKTNIEGLESVQKNLKTIIHDAGYKVEKTAQGVQRLVKDKKRSVSVKHTMELGKRINKKINWEELEPHVKDNFKKVVKAAKNDVRAGLKDHPDALAAFDLAEAEHGRVAEKYGTDAVKKVRKTEAGEVIAKTIDNPTVLKDLQKTMSPKEYAKVQREVLENLREMDYLKSEKHLREVNKYLSKENQQLAKELVEAKNPRNPVTERKAAKEAILTDVSKALTEGTRPNKTLNLWQTKQGQRTVRETFKNSPDGPDVIKYLEKQSFDDMVKTVMKDGVLDSKKLSEMLENPAMVNNILDLGGEEALNFLVKMESRLTQLRENAELLKRLPTKTEAKRGEQILERAAERNKHKITEYKKGQEVLKPNKTSKEQEHFIEHEQGKLKRGQKILERMAKKDYPYQTAINEWTAWGKDMLGLKENVAMNIFGAVKLGAPGVGAYLFGGGVTGAAGAMIGARWMSAFLTNPKARREFIKMTKKGIDPTAMILYLHNTGKAVKE